MRNLTKTYWHGLLLCLWGLLSLFSQLVYAAPDIVAQNYASARSPGIQSCTVGYDLMSGDVGYGQSLINGALPYSLNYRAPLRQNLSAAQVFAQPEESSLGWTDNYQAHVFVQNITSTTTEYTQSTIRQVTTNPVKYELTTKTPVTRINVSAKEIWIRLPGESTDTVFKEENGNFTRLYSADAVRELNNNSIQSLPWNSDLGEYQLSRSGNNIIIVKNGVKYTVSDSSSLMSPEQTYTDKINVYLDKNKNLITTRDSWHFFSFGIPADAISNTALLLKTDTTVSLRLYRIAKIENQGSVLNLQYDNNMNLAQVSDRYNNKLVFEHNFHDSNTGSSQTIDESRLVTKVTYIAAQGGSQVATFNYQAYVNKVAGTGTNTTVFALISSDSTVAGTNNYVNEMTEIGAVKAFVASKGRTADSSYYYPVLRQVKNSLGQIVRQWDITQNYSVTGSGDNVSYSAAQTTLRAYVPLASGTAQDFTTVYDDIAKSIVLTFQINSNMTTSTVKTTVNADNNITVQSTGHPCLKVNGRPVNSVEFETARSRLIKVTNGNNVVSSYEYDNRNRLTGFTEAVGTALSRKTSYTYGALNDNSANIYPTPTSVSMANLSISNVLNPRGQIVTQTQTSSQSGSIGKTTSYGYEENVNSPHFARMLSVDGPRSGTADRIDYSYDNYGYLSSQSQYINGAIRTTQYLGYDVFGQPERIVSPNGMVEQFIYNADGTLASQTTGVGGTSGGVAGQTTGYTYNTLKQRTSETNPDGEMTQFEYDLAGRLSKKILPTNAWVEYIYYPIGVLKREDHVSSAGKVVVRNYQFLMNKGWIGTLQRGSDGTQQSVVFSFDNNGNIKQSTTSGGIVEKWTYDALDRVKTHTDGEGNVDTKDYDLNDNLVLEKDALNAGTNPYSYRNGNTLTQEVNSDYGTKTYNYNEADQLTQRKHGLRQCNYLNIDESGRVQRQQCHPEAPRASLAYDDTFGYDQTRFGRLDQVVSNTNYGTNTLYSFDAYDRVTQKSQTNKALSAWGGTASPLTVKYTYSNGGKLTRMTLPSGRKIIYNYNAAGQLVSIYKDSTVVLNKISYNTAGLMTGWNWGSSQATYSWTYNASHTGTIKKITNTRAKANTSYSLDYSFDLDGQITQLTRNEGESVDSFAYDRVGRLTSENRSGAGAYTIGYSYDSNGNRSTLRASGSHQQIAANVDYTYTGNTLTAWYKNGAAQPLGYTAQSDLIQPVLADATYDGSGRRIWQQSYNNVGYDTRYNHKNERTITSNNLNGGWKASNAIQYVYDEESHLIGEYDDQGNQIVEYVWLGDKPVAAIHGYGSTIKIYYIVTDAQNTPRRLVDSSNQEIVWAWDSTAFGVGQPQGNITFNLRFPGQYYDASSNLFYNHNRYYNPELGRYMEPDPIGLEGGSNPYAYAGSNPVMNTDASGLCPMCLVAAPTVLETIAASTLNMFLNTAGMAGVGYMFNETFNKPAATPFPDILTQQYQRNQNYEMVYRTMERFDAQFLQRTNTLKASHETFISPSLAYVSQYQGVTMEIKLRTGTLAGLYAMGVADQSSTKYFPGLQSSSSVSDWKQTNALFKLEGVGNPYFFNKTGVINIGLGSQNGAAMTFINSGRIIGARPVPRIPEIRMKSK
ncbi:RHS repeat domain-containing protein [Acinetobacter sp.]|uniref:RHS repeat domain-containing protein n=1 Tax=Acinetobacter sp. TaxID=472 RepID=UPI002FD8AE31